jgi:glucose-6-phosphate dehydrogenase assembly protein OpcA
MEVGFVSIHHDPRTWLVIADADIVWKRITQPHEVVSFCFERPESMAAKAGDCDNAETLG